MDVRSFKLQTGEELIAQLLGETGTGYKIKLPLVIHIMRGQDGQGTLAFAQWSMIQKPDEEVELLDGALACRPVKVLAEVESSYIQQTSSIILPAAPEVKQILRG